VFSGHSRLLLHFNTRKNQTKYASPAGMWQDSLNGKETTMKKARQD